MSVESCTPAAPKITAGGAGHSGKGKTRAAGEAGAMDAGGFSALLMMLGANEPDIAAASSDELTLAVEGAAPELLTRAEKADADGEQVDPGLLLVQSMQFQQSPPPGDERLVTNPERSLAIAVTGQVNAQVQLAQPELIVAPLQQAQSEQVAVSLPQAQPEPVNVPLQQAQPEGAILAPPLAAKGPDVMRPELGAAIKDVAAKAVLPQRSAPRVVTAEVAAVQSGVANANANIAAEVRMHQLAQVEPRVEVGSGLVQTLVASGSSESGVRRAERVGEKMAFGRGGDGDGAWGHQALLAPGSADQSFSTGEPAAVMSPEAMVAEQVNYWIGHDVQNAELKLDGLGGSPVEVSISLQGNEARVEFRTDQSEARQVLEGAVSHLKDLLGNEGLVLSGVSVGSSGAGGGAFQERQPHQNGRQATVAVPQAQSVDMTARPARPSGRSVDLFV